MPSVFSNLVDVGKNIAASSNPGREAVAQLWSIGIENVTGQMPVISRKPDATYIDWNPGQAAKMEKWLRSIVLSRVGIGTKPTKGFSVSDVKVNFRPVIVPLVVKAILPTILLIAAGAYMAGRYSKKRK